MRNDLILFIQELILSYRYKPGERIKEEEIATDLGISRTPIREALAVLEQQGLVEQKPHCGTFVATFTSAEIVDLLRLEAVLEGLAASRAAENISDEQIAELEDLNHKAESELSIEFDNERFYSYDRIFHNKIVDCSGSQIIRRSVEVQLARIYLCRLYTITAPNRFKHSIREHKELLESIKKRDPVLAEASARKHLDSVIKDFLTMQTTKESVHE
jgi:DNA-binding GntR family transcriptional regulator